MAAVITMPVRERCAMVIRAILRRSKRFLPPGPDHPPQSDARGDVEELTLFPEGDACREVPETIRTLRLHAAPHRRGPAVPVPRPAEARSARRPDGSALVDDRRGRDHRDRRWC